MHFNIVTVFSQSERQGLKKAFQANQKQKAFLSSTTYYPKYQYRAKKYSTRYSSVSAEVNAVRKIEKSPKLQETPPPKA